MATTDRPRKSRTTANPSQSYISKYKTVGTRPIRHDGLDKVTGRARYGADTKLPGMLFGKILRSPHAHARIRSIDYSAALKLDGVKAVITSKDFPIVSDKTIDLAETQGNPRIMAENLLASRKVLFRGQGVAVVAATSQHIAEEALKLIKVDYEPLQPILDVREAMADGAPLLHDTLTTRIVLARFERGTDSGVKSNIASHLQFKRGDVEKGFREASVVVEQEFKTKPVHQGYIEPQASTAQASPDGRITIWTSSQGHFGMRSLTAAMLALPEHMVKVVPMEIGGGFGGKTVTYLDPLAAMLSQKTGKPVKIVLTRKEVFEGTGPASGTYMRVKVGADKNGRITAAQVYLAYEAGAFPGSAVGAGAGTGLAPYNIENILVDGFDVVVNKQKVTAYRAPGSPQASFGVETVMDEVAERLGLDPLEFRLKNATKEGDRMPSGVVYPRIGNVEVQQAMRDSAHYKSKLTGPNRGRGVAMGFWGNGGGQSSAALSVNTDGTVNVITGSVDVGGTRPAIAMQAAEVLGLLATDMVPSVGDTDSIGYTGVTGGSRTTMSTGIAAIKAAEMVREQMLARAALMWEVQPQDVKFENGVFINTKKAGERLTFKAVAGKTLSTGGPVNASASSNPRMVGGAFAGTIVDVEIDPETGKVTVLRCTCVQDVGQAAHPSYAEGQLQGGTVQGLGWALNEEYFFSSEGTMMNSSFLDYRMPISLDLPFIDTILVEVPNPGHPFGIRGVGEVSIVPVMAAVANAIHRASGVRLTELPMTPGKIMEALEKSLDALETKPARSKNGAKSSSHPDASRRTTPALPKRG